MKKRSKIACAIIAAMLTTSFVFSGCGKKQNDQATGKNARMVNGVDISKPVQLTMYLIGDSQPDADKVYAEVNKKLKKDINTTVNVKYLSWADWSKKYPLVLATGEDVDAIYTADWIGYAEQATKGAFKEMTPGLIKKYMPEYYAKVPKDFWNEIKINGKMYMIPYLNKQVEGSNMILYRGDLREKYNLPEIKSPNDLVNYLTTIVKNEKGMLGYDDSAASLVKVVDTLFYKQPNELYEFNTVPFFTTKLNDMNGTVSYKLDDPAYLDMLKTAKKLADAGAWPKSILASKDSNEKAFNSGKTPIIVSTPNYMMSNVARLNSTNSDWNVEVGDVAPDKLHESSSGVRSGMCIGASSKNAERTMLMLNLFGTHKDYYDLTTYGISGVHYTPVGDNQYKSTEEGTKNFAPGANCPWGWERTDFVRLPVGTPKDIANIETNWIKNGLASTNPIVSFNFDDSSVKNEVAACNNIYQTEGYILLTGLSANPEADLAKMKNELKRAGIDKIKAELQKQVTAYVQSLK